MLVMPRIEIEFEFDMVFCFGIRLALYAVVVFFHRIYLQHIAQPVESGRPINIVFVPPSIHQFLRSQFMNVGSYSITAWDRFMQFSN